MSATIRTAVAADLDEILALVRELAEFEQLSDEVAFDRAEFSRNLFGDDPVASVLIAEIDGRVAGMALWFRTFSTFLGKAGIWLEDLYVRPEHRGQGLGTALLRELRSLTDGRVEWSVLDWNERAIEVYRGLGARPLEEWTTYRWLPEA